MKRAKREDGLIMSGTNKWRVSYYGEIYFPAYFLDPLVELVKYEAMSSIELINDVKSVINYDIRSSENPRYMGYL